MEAAGDLQVLVSQSCVEWALAAPAFGEDLLMEAPHTRVQARCFAEVASGTLATLVVVPHVETLAWIPLRAPTWAASVVRVQAPNHGEH